METVYFTNNFSCKLYSCNNIYVMKMLMVYTALIFQVQIKIFQNISGIRTTLLLI